MTRYASDLGDGRPLACCCVPQVTSSAAVRLLADALGGGHASDATDSDHVADDVDEHFSGGAAVIAAQNATEALLAAAGVRAVSVVKAELQDVSYLSFELIQTIRNAGENEDVLITHDHDLGKAARELLVGLSADRDRPLR